LGKLHAKKDKTGCVNGVLTLEEIDKELIFWSDISQGGNSQNFLGKVITFFVL
jgi:hypothetical protein